MLDTLDNSQTILSVRNMKVHFPVKGAWPWSAKRSVKAVDEVSFDLHKGETLGVVGESGCGKSTLARSILNLIPATGGEIIWNGKSLTKGSSKDWLAVRRDIQFVFQDPFAALNPRMTVAQILSEPLRIHHPEISSGQVIKQVKEMMNKVGLREHLMNRYPHEFSGGQCQRIGIARALILSPKLLICDEPVSALDVSIQAQIINLLQELQREMGLALIFIAHNLAVVKHISDRVMVMYLGKIMELSEKRMLFNAPNHPYTKALLSAIPIPNPGIEKAKILQLQGDLPSPINPPVGCVFSTRCPQVKESCKSRRPELKEITLGHESACFLND